jgi:tetratricopeptide (TPR) repeat protein
MISGKAASLGEYAFDQLPCHFGIKYRHVIPIHELRLQFQFAGKKTAMKTRTELFQPYLQIALLLLAVIALYAGSLSSPLVFDDLAFFLNPEAIAKYSHFSLDSRWLSYATFSWTIASLGLDIFWLRFGNVLLHAANAIALFFLLRRLFQATLTNDDAPDGMPASLVWFAFFGALIFSLHPVAVYGVAYLIQRSTLMATLFVLLMLRVYLEGLLRGSWSWMLAAVLFYVAAVCSKEHSIAAPGVALALTFLIRKPSPALLRQIAPFSILLALIAAIIIYLYSTKGVLGTAYEPRAMEMLNLSAKMQELTNLPNTYLLSILTQSGLFFKYLGLWLLPNPAWMSVDMREPFAMSLFGWHTLGLMAFLAYFCTAVWLLLKQGRMGLLGFALLFPWILFLTEFSTVRIQEPFVLYRSYLWMPGLFAALPVVFGSFSTKKVFILLGIVSLLLIPLTLNRLNTFSSTLLLWDDAEKLVRNNPNAYGVERIYTNRGNKLFQLRRYDEAIADFSKAIAAYPNDELLYGSRAKALYFLGRYQESVLDYDRAIALKSDNKRFYYDRALTYRALGNFMAAQEDFRKSCELGGVCL